MARVLITREHAHPLAAMLKELGHTSVHVPLIELAATNHGPPKTIPKAVLITSQAVARFVPGLAQQIADAKVAVVGEATASALKNLGLESHAIGSQGGLEALRGLLGTVSGPIWYIGAERPSAGLAQALTDAGVERWPVYRNQRPEGYVARLEQATADAVTFASGSAVDAYADALGKPSVRIAVLGESTASRAAAHGFAVDAVAAEPSLRALATAVSKALA
jgi:uroporphyrinogen-III synthase